MSHVPNEAVVILTATDARMLWREARLNDLRLKHRAGDTRFYKVLVDIYQVGLLEVRNAAVGTEAWQSVASEERKQWTVKQLTAKTARAGRTIRLDIEQGRLPATKPGPAWLIETTDAEAYIASHKKN